MIRLTNRYANGFIHICRRNIIIIGTTLIPRLFPAVIYRAWGAISSAFTIVKSYLDQFAQLRRVADGLFAGRNPASLFHWHCLEPDANGRILTEQTSALPTPHPCQPQGSRCGDAALMWFRGFSSNTLNGDATDSNRLGHLIVSSGAMIEGSVGEQATDSPVVPEHTVTF